MSGAPDHLPRLLAMVPWLLARPGTTVAETAQQFGVSEDQVRKDLELVWMCGLPGYTPGDLVEVSIDARDRIVLSNADTIAKPLRLTAIEAVALIAALRSLAVMPGVLDSDAADRALAKLEAAAGASVDPSRVAAAPVSAAAPTSLGVLGEALAQQRRVHLGYWVPARDEVVERDVDPLRLFTVDGAAYLVGWCYRVDDLRTFRVDRIQALEVLDVAADPPPDARTRALDTSVFSPAPEDRLVTLDLDPQARWVAAYHPCESLEERGDGGLIVRLRARDDAWVRRLALGLAGHGRIVDPPELAAEVAAEAARALAVYG